MVSLDDIIYDWYGLNVINNNRPGRARERSAPLRRCSHPTRHTQESPETHPDALGAFLCPVGSDGGIGYSHFMTRILFIFALLLALMSLPVFAAETKPAAKVETTPAAAPPAPAPARPKGTCDTAEDCRADCKGAGKGSECEADGIPGCHNHQCSCELSCL